MKILSVRSLGEMPVYDLSVDHKDHSFVHGSGAVVHNCAYVISNEPVSNFIPLMKVGEDQVTVTQYTAGSVEAVGGLKMDFLVINSLKDIAVAIQLIQERSGWKPEDMIIDGEKVLAHEIVPFKGGHHSIWKLPKDQAVFRDFCEGNTETVFQFNTPGAVGYLKDYFNHVKGYGSDGSEVKALDSIEALSAFTALDRPGPLDYYVQTKSGGKHNMLVEFAIRARGGERTGALPILDRLLPETYSTIVYQEQLQKVYQMVGKTSAEQADEFRVHISKKKMSEVIKDKEVFMPGATEMLGEQMATELWNSMETFGQYGFNKSHSTAYVTISYACAFLKHHFPLEWWTAVLRHADKDEINNKFWTHCGHLIDLPDVKLSGENFEVINDRIRAPLSLLMGIGPGAHKQLMDYRPYSDLQDFCEKIQAHRKANATTVKKKKKVKYKVPTGEKKRGREVFETKEREEEVEVEKLGHNSLNSKVIATLVISGAMESLFPPGTPELDCLSAFNEMMAAVSGKKKPDKVDSKFANLDPFVRFQMRKAVLPAYSQPLLEIAGRLIPDRVGFVNDRWLVKTSDGQTLPGATAGELAYINERRPWPQNVVFTAAVVGYVQETRKFGYGAGREAVEIVLNTGAGVLQAVKWPEKSGFLKEKYTSPLRGSVVIATLTKTKGEKPFVIDDVEVVRFPLDHKTEESPEQSPENQ